MKKIYFSLISIAILLFSACSNDVYDNGEASGKGSLRAMISFEGKTVRGASSTAIPTVGWSNVKQVQLFLIKPDGSVAFSRTVKPTDSEQTFTWDNVPVGNYRLALLANVKSSTDDIATSVGGTWTELSNENVIGKTFNSSIKIDLKPTTLPSNIGPSSLHDWNLPTTQREGYLPPSEIFTAVTDITIAAGVVTNVPATDLVLRREIALMRTRFNIAELPVQSVMPQFGNAGDFIVIQRVPAGFGLPVGAFQGGILDDPSDEKKVLVGATGTDAYKKADPATGYNPNLIIHGDFTMWNDIHVFPNAPLKDGKGKEDAADTDRKYFIIISASVDAGYVYADGTIAQTNAQPVYWFGTIDGVFTKNVIREVNMKLVTAGYPEIPGGPGDFGGLKIIVGAPENWDSMLVNANIDV